MGTHPIFESDFDCLTEMKVVKYGLLYSLVSGESFGSVKSQDAIKAQEAVQKLRNDAMAHATEHIVTDEMRAAEEQHLKDVHKESVERMAAQGAKHHKKATDKEAEI